ncbi:MAG: histidine kinase N-terminal 7TM domain-containing protein [Haloarculaceae archaeon]
MAWHPPLAVLPYAAVGVAMGVLAAVSYRSRDVPAAAPLAALSALAGYWSIATGVALLQGPSLSPSPAARAAYLAIATIPVALVYFAAEYTGRDPVVTRYGPIPLLIVPAITQVVVWTNGAHELMWPLDPAGSGFLATHGPWFWVHSVYSYGLIAIATYHLLRTLAASDHNYRAQSIAFLLGLVAPWIVNATLIAGVVAWPADPTPLAFSVTGACFAVAVSRHRLLEIVPAARDVARDELMDNLFEAVFILDSRGQVVECNEQATHLVAAGVDSPVDRPLAEVAPDLAAAIDGEDEATDDGPARTEIALRRDDTLRHYDVTTTELNRGGGLITGTLVSLRDVTEARQREQRLNVLNRALRHDLRNEANVILGYAELGRKNHSDAEWVDAILEHVGGMVELSRKVRRLEQALDGESVAPTRVDVAAVVASAVDDLENERPDVDVETVLPDGCHAAAIELFDEAVRNALENAVEHNDNPEPLIEVSVTVRRTDDGEVEIRIADNGPGIPEDERAVLLRGRETQLEHVSGLGLWIINWIVTESGGTIDIEPNDPRGSVVTMCLPAADDVPADAAGAGSAATPDGAPGSGDGAQVEPDGCEGD